MPLYDTQSNKMKQKYFSLINFHIEVKPGICFHPSIYVLVLSESVKIEAQPYVLHI